jgi:cell shape-determining protein MreC
MIYLQTKNKRRGAKTLFVILLTAVLVVSLSNLFIEGGLSALFYKIGHPLWEADSYYGKTLKNFVSYFKTKSSLDYQNNFLKNENAILREKLSIYSETEKQNLELKELLGRFTEKKIILAGVLSAPPRSPYDVLIIDAGTRNGIQAGDRVITAGGSVIGEIVSALGDFSRVGLYTSPGRTLSGFLGEKRIPVEVVGIGGGNFEMILPKEEQVVEGESVFLPGLDNELIGTVSNVLTRDVDFLQLATVSAPVNLYELRYVGVVASSSRPAI